MCTLSRNQSQRCLVTITPTRALSFRSSISRVQDSVHLVDDSVVGEDINRNNTCIIKADGVVKDGDEATLERVNSDDIN
jgi:hypothetical protein